MFGRKQRALRRNTTPMLFLGLDLAWGKTNGTGGAALSYQPGQPAAVCDVRDALSDDADILAWVDHWDKAKGHAGLLVGIDAPLLVPNLTGKRPCEAEIGRRFAKFQAGAHPANRTLFRGYVRGEDLAQSLAERQIAHDPVINTFQDNALRQVMEVFPHPAHVVLFGLAKTLKYKAKPGRTYEARWAVFAEYGRLLRSLAACDPPLALPADWPPPDVSGMVGNALKRLEDSLDALTCAYIVYYYWWHGPRGGEVIGNMTDGYIVVPRARKQAALQSKAKQERQTANAAAE